MYRVSEKAQVGEITDTQIILEDETSIDKAAFEKWVDYDERRETELNYSDENGEHVQKCETLTWDEYYENPAFPYHLAEYLAVREAKTGKLKNLPDMAAALRKLVNS